MRLNRRHIMVAYMGYGPRPKGTGLEELAGGCLTNLTSEKPGGKHATTTAQNENAERRNPPSGLLGDQEERSSVSRSRE
jgi:hypothetical protein